jgi:hypothetical protein
VQPGKIPDKRNLIAGIEGQSAYRKTALCQKPEVGYNPGEIRLAGMGPRTIYFSGPNDEIDIEDQQYFRF